MLAMAALKANSQVTSSSITGTVMDSAGNYLEGATITATHTPSGTVYTTLSRKGGVFVIPSARIGGPYTIKVDYVGYKSYQVDGITLILGEPYNINAVMGEEFKDLASVVVTVQRRKSAVDKTGASTNVGQRQITSLPTISRSITDFTRLTPQANGTSFGGRDARYNNVQVDGANLNNNFGLSSDLLPGGGNQPISLDAIEELSINIAPYDVRQAGFTGAGVNAVTKSGTNTLKGTAYAYYRDQSFNGTRVGDTKLPEQQKEKNQIYGMTLGGPIIKNKLFFFVSGELEERTFPGINWSPSGGSGKGQESNTPIDSLRKLSEFLKSQYGYDTGPYDNFPDFKAKNHKILGKIDWNINNVHKLTLKYNELVSNNDVALNATSVPNGLAGAIGYSSTQRFGRNAMSFANSNYGFKDVVRNGTLELNSNFGGRFANQFLVTMTKIKATRTSPSEVFPFIDILNNNNNNYMSAGYEPYSYNNDVINDVYSIINNFSYFAGRHRVTAGVSYEYQRVGNMFMPASQSYYVFNSLDDFINNRAPKGFALTYSLVPGKESVYSAELKLGQLGLYVQDEITFNERLKMTFGLRLDRPIYHEDPLENPAITALTLPDKNGNPTHYNTGKWPKSTFYWSPRVGFRWDPEGNKVMIVRGGTGLFTGKIPFVWLTNMPTNSGMYQFGAAVSDPAQLQNFLFDPNPAAHRSKFPSEAGTSVPSAGIVLIDPDFKFPQVWRTNLAFDRSFGNGWMLTMEALYTKDVNAVRMRNANQKEPNDALAGPDNRPRFNPADNTNRRLYPGINNAIVLENSSKGGGFSFTTQISKTMARGLSGSIAYTYTFVQDITPNPGSQAASVWSANPTTGTQNDIQLAYSQYAVPHRIVGTVSYRFEYLKHLATTVSLYYEGAPQGVFSYAYNGDVNGDGNAGSVDLMYIPRDPSEIIFVDQAPSATTDAYTAQEQSDAFFRYLEQDKYLRKHKGQYAERNGARFPWYHRLDFKLLQDIFTDIGNRKHTLQLSVDVLNFANLINKHWGIRKQLNYTNGFQSNPLVFAGYNASGQPTFRMAQVEKKLVTETFSNVKNVSTTWGLQVGLRYIF
jgi:hypothetical protein